ncbi:MAG: prolyl oligopeptidase family serine peptidase [Planctomycetes bacterium]|nr:prolyl oligopeptidase family serine peptidase [Planctomycetota bacterium]
MIRQHGRPTANFHGILIAATLALVALVAPAPAAEPDGSATKIHHVAKTFNDRPFDYTITLHRTFDRFSVYRLTYPSPMVTPVERNNTVPAEYYLPHGITPGDAQRGAVVCLHILNGNFELVRITCSKLASRGIPAVMIVLPYYGPRSLPGGHDKLAADPQLFTAALDQAIADVRRTLDLLASREEVDAEKLGLCGISMGGILAGTAAAVDARVWRTTLILAGGDLPAIIAHARETRAMREASQNLLPRQRSKVDRAIAAIDPLTHAAKLRGRARQGRVLMINAAADGVIPRACTEKLAEALGIGQQVVWLEGLGHYTAMAALPRVLQTTAEFFARDLPADDRPADVDPAVSTTTRPRGVRALIAVAGQFRTLVAVPPEPGRCHRADLELSITTDDGKNHQGRIQFIHGAEHRFKLQADLPTVGRVSVGQGTYPWIASSAGTVFRASSETSEKPGDPLRFADPQYLTRLKMLSGALAAVALAPEVIEPLAEVTDELSPEGTPVIRVRVKKGDRGTGQLFLADDGVTPKRLTFSGGNIRGTVVFGQWQINAAAEDELFDEPRKTSDGAPLVIKEVDHEELTRIFSAMFNFVMETVQ